MKEKNPLEFLTDQLNKLLELVHNFEKNPSQGELPPNIFEMIESLQRDVAQLADVSKTIEDTLPTKLTTMEKRKKLETMAPKDKLLIERLRKMRSEADEIKFRLTQASYTPPDKPFQSQETKKKGQPSISKKMKSKRGWKKM